jgi:virulence-associated protein VapD
MTKITIDDTEYDQDKLSEDQLTEVTTLRNGQNALSLLDHITQCVQAVQTMKLDKLKESLKN